MTRATEARVTDAARKRKEEDERIKAREEARLRRAFCETFATESGQKVLQWIMDSCSYQRPLLAVNPHTGEALNTSLYAEGRRTLYLRIRGFLRRDILDQVERGQEGTDEAELLT